MTAWIANIYEPLKASFWFLPTIIIAGTIGIAVATIQLDHSQAGRDLIRWLPGSDQMQVEGARRIVATVAGSTITVATVVISVVFLALTLMSQQFGPRILVMFMKDRYIQFVIGIFFATFAYAIIVLGAIGVGSFESTIPRVSVYAVSVLAFVAFGFLVFFIHHMAISIQADAVVAHLGQELQRVIEAEMLERPEGDGGDQEEGGEDDELFGESARPVYLGRSGYVQLIDFERATQIATEQGARVRFTCRPGHFVVEDMRAAEFVLDKGGKANKGKKGGRDALAEKLAETVELGARRTQAQYAEYEVNALVEVALRALSPGINDPYTAVACIDHLTAGLFRLMRGEARPTVLCDEKGTPRVYRYPQTFRHFVDSAFHPLRQSASRNPQTLLHLAHAMEVLSAEARSKALRQAILAHVEMLREDNDRETENSADRERVAAHLDRVEKRLKSS